MNETIDGSGTPNDRDKLEQLIEQAKAWSDGDHLSHLIEQAKAWSNRDHVSQLAEQARAWSNKDHVHQLAEQARAWSNKDHVHQLAEQARAWSNKDHVSQLAEQARAWSNKDQVSQLAEQARTWRTDMLGLLEGQATAIGKSAYLSRLAQRTLPAGLTLDDLLSELATRPHEPPEVAMAAADLEDVSVDQDNQVSIGDFYDVEIKPTPGAKPRLSSVPTWLLVLWAFFILPALAIVKDWEDVRAGLVDINERIPETYSFSSLKRFIRSNLAGKAGDIRLVTGSDVRLRVEPGMKSAVLLTLPKYAPVVVLDKEDRTWLYVSYEHEGFLIDGYVSTKFLRKVRR
ncbi:SH3 domain-containing protein [Pseudomonas graminis]|uniref:SH3 domain-containing protein n=1 Tax=Pseudomonas graminis TaxID=158627 RepID=A0A1C2DRI0_9PSED|nr:SH3 domain-containing protein [Pseudomonas graminis]OCX17391.1 hypothetical protein BBI10_17955 [Pseudomonas graminis]